MKQNLIYVSLSLLLFLAYSCTIFGSGDDDLTEIAPKISGEWVYMKVEYFHDLITPKRFFAVGVGTTNQIPLVKGGYASTDVWLEVVARGVDVPRSLQEREDRSRPKDYILRERERWDSMLHYVWNLIEPTHTFRAYDFEVLTYDGKGKAKVVEADLEILLGGNWHNLAMFMLGDEHARPSQADGSEWDFGSLNVGLLNPNIPK